MMTTDPAESGTILQNAVEALKRGDRDAAQRLAEQAALLAPETEAPWLILAALTSPAESLEYARKAMQINPDSQAAKQALDWALHRLHAQPVEKKVEPPPEPAPQVEASLPPRRRVRQEKKRLSQNLIILTSVVVVLVVAVIAVVIWLVPQLRNSLGPLSPDIQPSSQALLPAQQTSCDPGLALGAHAFAVQTIQPAAGVALDVPAGDLTHAYWVEGTHTHPFFLLSPAPDNLSLANSLQGGEPAIVTWADCNMTTFFLFPAEPGSLDSASLADQSNPQITIFIPPAAGSDGLLIQGEMKAEDIPNFATPSSSDVVVEISVHGIITSADRSTITVRISIYNIGQSDATLTANDISLKPENAMPQPPVKTVPGLPFVIKAGDMKPIDLTFPRPVAAIATLKVFTAEYDLEGY
jgi:hypothetical protein